MKTVYAVGLGPGSLALLTPEAREVIGHCDTIAGYKTYLDQIPELLSGKRIVANGMRQEGFTAWPDFSSSLPNRKSSAE